MKSNLDIDIRVLGIASSSRMLLSEEGIDLSNWKEQFARCVTQGRSLRPRIGDLDRPVLASPRLCQLDGKSAAFCVVSGCVSAGLAQIMPC